MAGLSITAHCKTLTPILSGGAIPRERFELRAQSIKGVLRFWWRAFHAYAREDDLFDEESCLFGGKKRKPRAPNQWEAVAGSFRLDVCCDLDRSCDKDNNMIFCPGGAGKYQGSFLGDDITSEWGEGVRYFFFPILHYTGKIHNITKGGRPVVKEGLTFKLRFFVPDGNRDVLADLLRAMWLLMNFGGLGGRTRRGAGSFTIERFEPPLKDFALPDVPQFDYGSHGDPATYINVGLKMIRKKWFHVQVPFDLPSYTAFRPGHSEILVCFGLKPGCGVGSGALKAMEAIGRKMKDFRYTNPSNEAEQMHDALTGEGAGYPPPFSTLQKAELGLPIIYNFRGRGQFGNNVAPDRNIGYTAVGVVYDEKKGKAEIGSKENVDRRASPLLISCHVFKDTPYAVICHFPAPILPDGQRIWLKSKPPNLDHFPKAPTGYDYIDRLVKLGADVNGDKREPIRSAFRKCWWLYQRPRSDPQATTSEPSKPPEPDKPLDPEERKIKCLKDATRRKDGLMWYLGEFVGSSTGTGKREKWACNLWHLDGESLKKDPETWYARLDKLSFASGLTTEKGNLFLCTKQSDPRTRPSGQNYLYNITKPM